MAWTFAGYIDNVSRGHIQVRRFTFYKKIVLFLGFSGNRERIIGVEWNIENTYCINRKLFDIVFEPILALNSYGCLRMFYSESKCYYSLKEKRYNTYRWRQKTSKCRGSQFIHNIDNRNNKEIHNYLNILVESRLELPEPWAEPIFLVSSQKENILL